MTHRHEDGNARNVGNRMEDHQKEGPRQMGHIIRRKGGKQADRAQYIVEHIIRQDADATRIRTLPKYGTERRDPRNQNTGA